MEITFLRAGMLTTVQDRGRPRHRGEGVPLSGAMDSFAFRLANLLVGNSQDAAGLEITLVGPEIVFSEERIVAITGGAFPSQLAWQPFTVKAGESLKFGPVVRGCRGYLAISGGLNVPAVLGSTSTNLRDGLGGHEGRALRDGDVLEAHPTKVSEVCGGWHIDPSILPRYSPSPTVRIVSGAHAEEFKDDWLYPDYTVTARSDRMGIRLSGPPLNRRVERELLSSAVGPGTIQIPPDGQPIVLMADAQTIGGYPQLGHVISVDLPLLAQLRPGEAVRFMRVSLEEAHHEMAVRERALALLERGLSLKVF